jgi:putative heme-binding domain-containing protein
MITHNNSEGLTRRAIQPWGGGASLSLKVVVEAPRINLVLAAGDASQGKDRTQLAARRVFARLSTTPAGENSTADARGVIDYAGLVASMTGNVHRFVNNMLRSHLALLGLILLASPILAQDPFALGVRETPHLTPQEEQKQFKLPPGFEIQLVAAEPEIQKPLNMAFDAKGRLWVTNTVEYTYPAPLDKPDPRDSIKVIEFDYDTGKATKITTFADKLNIPIGVLPYKNGCIAHSIPNIWYFEDTNDDGVCDKRTVLYGPFDFSRDTHGMENAFRRGYDGWIYACHGFNNDSHVKGKDGHEVHLNSGNTFRFRPDGSRIEHFSVGQVNPFGMCFDPLFNIFTADCHSKPVTQILRGGNYESFGKPHDGLGFVPPMMDHLHGSTAICGLVIVDGENFPKQYRGQFLSGNVMTSRINHNTPEYHGSTIRLKEEPDFLSTGDPWFRPVDLQIGPDGALYIADFYNRIIGHYEVPLPHPGRDRTSGRIWRVVYKGDAKESKPAVRQKDLTKATADELIAMLDHPVLTQRLLATDELVQRTNAFAEQTGSPSTTLNPRRWLHLQWILWRRGVAIDDGKLKAAAASNSPEVRVHTMKLLSEMPQWSEGTRKAALAGLDDGDDFVVRAAADALGQHPHLPDLFALTHRLKSTPPEDNHLAYVLSKALRSLLVSAKDQDDLKRNGITINNEWKLLGPIALAVPTEVGAAFTLAYLQNAQASADQLLPYVTHAARYARAEQAPQLRDAIQGRWAGDLDLQLKALLALQQGLAQRGQSLESIIPWAEELGTKLLDQADNNVIPWENFPVPGAKDTENPWSFQQRVSADGNKDAIFYSTLVNGEQKTGILRSQPFELPEKLSFWCAGHIGLPPKVLDFNYIRLRAAGSDELLAESRPPRNDVAQKIEWDLAKHKGEQGYVEIVDADAGGAYAWLAVGRFSLAALNPNEVAQRQQAVARLIGELKLKKFQPKLAELLTSGTLDAATRGAIGSALVALTPDARAAALVRIVSEPGSEIASRQKLTKAIASLEDQDLQEALTEALKELPARMQSAVAESLAGDVNGVTALLQLVTQGRLTANVLRLPAVKQKIAALKHEALQKQADELTANLPPVNELLDKLIVERRAAFDKADKNPERGAEVFAKNCAACHQIAGKGFVVGPQLDGIGQRGLDRILEDVLDPNRNVDVAFRATTLVLNDGRIVSGLVKGEEGEQLIVFDNLGKEQRIAKSDVDERNGTALSLMPANVHEIVAPQDFYSLVEYLLQQKAKPKE